MTGSRSVTTSPSTLITMRKTPCVAGCCGPTLTLISTVSRWRSPGIRVSRAIYWCSAEKAFSFSATYFFSSSVDMPWARASARAFVMTLALACASSILVIAGFGAAAGAGLGAGLCDDLGLGLRQLDLGHRRLRCGSGRGRRRTAFQLGREFLELL